MSKPLSTGIQSIWGVWYLAQGRLNRAIHKPTFPILCGPDGTPTSRRSASEVEVAVMAAFVLAVVAVLFSGLGTFTCSAILQSCRSFVLRSGVHQLVGDRKSKSSSNTGNITPKHI